MCESFTKGRQRIYEKEIVKRSFGGDYRAHRNSRDYGGGGDEKDFVPFGGKNFEPSV
jgi:hypothetical protein